MNAVLVNIWVPGRPRTKGSLSIHGKHVKELPGSPQWRMLVADRARAYQRAHFTEHYVSPGPVSVDCTFWLPEPADIGADSLFAGVYHQSGDVDKLARNVLDALSSPASKTPTASELRKCARVYVDDVKVHMLRVAKFAVTGTTHPIGAHIVVQELDGSFTTANREHAAMMSRHARMEGVQ